MRVSYNWLKDYVNINVSPEELAKKMTMAGLEVDEIEYLGEEINGVVTAFVKEKSPHPNSDKLSVCMVDDGTEIYQVVCGAPNVEAGQKVPFAKTGASLPGGFKIEKTVIRGVESAGMICSGAELGIDEEDNQGIMVLPQDITLGLDIVEALQLKDAVLILELTPNRSDCLSMLNTAREAAAILGLDFIEPMVKYLELGQAITQLASVKVEDTNLCPRYAARLVRDVKIGPSPLWMQRYLLAAGMRPINNVVDISNFVMLETGQPLHTFDYQKLKGGNIIVRAAKAGEVLTTLDKKDRELEEGMILICDTKEPVCVAGVMGGLTSEVTEDTVDVLIEAACFDPVSIRRTARALNIPSESSARFEKGIDITNCDKAARRCAQLLIEYCGGTACQGNIDVYRDKCEDKRVPLRLERINYVLGTNYNLEEVANIMHRLSFTIDKDGGMLWISVPAYRQDITLEVDLIEEVARMKGLDNIAPTLPASRSHGFRTPTQKALKELREACMGLGLYEVINYSFLSPKEDDRLLLATDHSWRKHLVISNPLSEEQSVMRNNMIPGMIQTVARNHSRRNLDLGLFETGTVFELQDDGNVIEKPAFTIALSGEKDYGWQGQKEEQDYFVIKGIFEALADKFNLSQVSFKPVNNEEYPFLHPGRSAVIYSSGRKIGFLGEIHPLVAGNYGLEKKVTVLEVALDAFYDVAGTVVKCRELAKYPAVERDIALIGSSNVPAEDIIADIKEKGGEYLENVELFDLYDKPPIPEGQRSLAYSLTFQAKDRTLTDTEINQRFNDIVEHLNAKWDLKLR